MDKRTFLKYSICAACGFAVGIGRTAPAATRFLSSLAENNNEPYTRKAMHYITTPRGVKCKLCPQACELDNGETGDCRTRINKDGELYTLAYGNPCALHIDPIEKKPLYHFLPASKTYSLAIAGCNLACLNCQNWTISQASPTETRNYDLMPARAVKECIKHGCDSIAYTYAEPIAFYDYTYDTATIAHKEGVRNIFISAGYINEKPLREICPKLDAANIDLKSFSNEVYEMLNAGTLDPVLRTLKILKEEGVWLEITNLIVPSWTDDMDLIKKMCDWLVDNGFQDTPLHFSRFQPMYKLKNLPPTPTDTLLKAHETARKAGLHYAYIGNAPGAGHENTICPSCNKVLIKRMGYRLAENNIKNGACAFCNEPIAGVWE